MLHTINTLLTTTPPPSSKLLVVGTMTLPDTAALDEPAALNLPELFLQHQLVPMLDAKSVLTFIASRNIHRYICHKVECERMIEEEGNKGGRGGNCCVVVLNVENVRGM